MKADLKILPETGRGTIRRMVEGHPRHGATSRRPVTRPVPLHHLRWSPSPCRGGISTHGTPAPASLNLLAHEVDQ